MSIIVIGIDLAKNILAGFVDTMDGKDVLGQINSDDDNIHDFPSWWCG